MGRVHARAAGAGRPAPGGPWGAAAAASGARHAGRRAAPPDGPSRRPGARTSRSCASRQAPALPHLAILGLDGLGDGVVVVSGDRVQVAARALVRLPGERGGLGAREGVGASSRGVRARGRGRTGAVGQPRAAAGAAAAAAAQQGAPKSKDAARGGSQQQRQPAAAAARSSGGQQQQGGSWAGERAFCTASLTSAALPWPQPSTPLPLPTTTRQE